MYSLEIFIYMFFSFNLSFKLVQENTIVYTFLSHFVLSALKKEKEMKISWNDCNKGHFYSVQTERTRVSAANLGTRYVVGWASLWCSDWLLVKPEEEGGSNPCTERPIWAASRAACGGRGETMELPGFTLSSDR